MKKAVFVLLSLTILMFCIIGSAIADDFSVRNGIRFGMTVDEVKAIEQGSPSGEMYEGNKDGYRFLRYNGFDSIAGIPTNYVDGGRIDFFFTESNKGLKEIRYDFGGYGKSSVADYYAQLCDNLIIKYGTPFNTDTNSVFSGCTYKLTSYLESSIFQLVALSEQIAEFNDYYILIDTYVVYEGGAYYLNVGYKQISHDEMEKLQMDFSQSQEEKNKEIINDL